MSREKKRANNWVHELEPKTKSEIILTICTRLSSLYQTKSGPKASLLSIPEDLPLLPSVPYEVNSSESKPITPVAYIASIRRGELGSIFLIPDCISSIGRARMQRSDYKICMQITVVEAYQWSLRYFPENDKISIASGPNDWGSIKVTDTNFKFDDLVYGDDGLCYMYESVKSERCTEPIPFGVDADCYKKYMVEAKGPRGPVRIKRDDGLDDLRKRDNEQRKERARRHSIASKAYDAEKIDKPSEKVGADWSLTLDEGDILINRYSAFVFGRLAKPT